LRFGGLGGNGEDDNCRCIFSYACHPVRRCWGCYRPYIGTGLDIKAMNSSLIHSLALRVLGYGNSDIRTDGELNVLKALGKFYSDIPCVTIFDVGSNRGEYALHALRYFPYGRVSLHLFDPQMPFFHLGIFHGIALSDKEGDIVLHASSDLDLSGMASIYQRRQISPDKVIHGRSETIDLFCERNIIPRIHLLKLDVEGHELSVLKGAKRMMEENRIDFIQFEFGGCNIDSRTYLRDFYDLFLHRYEIWRVGRFGLSPMGDYDERNEIFTTMNYLAVHNNLPPFKARRN
jgi:FkbM family methyltransferase